MKVIMLGPQGSGKGTQGVLLAQKLGCDFVSLGDLLREDPVMRARLADGELLSDAEVDHLALDKLGAAGSLVFDGYPRRASQAQTLVRAGALPDLAVDIEVPEDELVQRLLLRGREDDTETAIRRRLEQYHAEQSGVMQVLTKAKVRIIKVDGTGTPEEVFARIVEKLG